MKEALGLGVVGAGAIGQRCALSHLSLPDVQDRIRITAVCDTYPGRAEATSSLPTQPHSQSFQAVAGWAFLAICRRWLSLQIPAARME